MKTLSLFLCLVYFALEAQVRLPVLSPAASISRVVGVTKITIDYSSPGVRGRKGKIWGTLVPYDVTWRAGANAPTTITFQDDVVIAGKKVSKGSYSIFITPSKGLWKLHINKGNTKGKSVFDFMVDGKPNLKNIEYQDVVTLSLDPQQVGSSVEYLDYEIILQTESKAKIRMSWENVSLSFTVETDPTANAEKTAQTYFHWLKAARTAEFYLDNNSKLEESELLARYSVKSQDHFFNKWILAKVLYKKKNHKEALQYAKAAQAFGNTNPSNFYDNYKTQITAAIENWK